MRLCKTLQCLALLTICTNTNAGDLPEIEGHTVELYATLCTPGGLAFDLEDFLFVGNGGCGGAGDGPAWVRRVWPGGRIVENYGQAMINDPDVVVFDSDGFVAEPGSVLIGKSGAVVAILPDGATETVVTSVGNIRYMIFDDLGRLLIADWTTGDVMMAVDGAGEVLFTVPSIAPALATDSAGRIFTFSDDGVIRIHDVDGQVIDDGFVTGLGDHGHMTIAPAGPFEDYIYVSVAGEIGLLYEIDPEGSVEVIGSNLTGDTRLDHAVFGANNALYVGQGNLDRILRITPESCPADLNEDSVVDGGDLLVLLGFWGACDDCEVCLGDFDNNCSVGSLDLIELLGNWGPCPK